MNRYYYTFGSDIHFPYQNGWVEIHADSLEQAHEQFSARFPDRYKNTLNCAFWYDAERWAQMDPEHTWHGWKCFEVIKQVRKARKAGRHPPHPVGDGTR